MNPSPDHFPEFERLARRLVPGGRLVGVRPLKGGVSARVDALDIRKPGGVRETLVVRRPGGPRSAAEEFALLQALRAEGLPVPAPKLLGEAGEIFPEPFLAMEFVEGETVFAPSDPLSQAERLAECLAAIHRLDGKTPSLAFFPRQEDASAETLAESPEAFDGSILNEPILNALAKAWPPARLNAPALLHGDFWPGNVLFREGRVAAVLDWEDAALGDPLFDLGNARLEILWAFGSDAMERFTEHYFAEAPGVDSRSLPVFDLLAALRPAGKLSAWGLAPEAERSMRERCALFVEAALERLA